MSTTPFRKVRRAASFRSLELTHSDICGPITPGSIGHSKYFITFIGDYSSFVKVFALRSKGDVFKCFVKFKNESENELCNTIVRFRTDN